MLMIFERDLHRYEDEWIITKAELWTSGRRPRKQLAWRLIFGVMLGNRGSAYVLSSCVKLPSKNRVKTRPYSSLDCVQTTPSFNSLKRCIFFCCSHHIIKTAAMADRYSFSLTTFSPRQALLPPSIPCASTDILTAASLSK